jgi:hypothetical protein
MRASGLTVALCLLIPTRAAAEWQVRPFVGFTFGSSTTFVDPDHAITPIPPPEGGPPRGTKNIVWGVAGGWIGEIVGLEADFGRAPGFFEVDAPPVIELVRSSAVTTLTGNVVIAMPAHMAGYGLRPFFSGGLGLMHVDLVTFLGGLPVNRTLPALSLGGGVTGFFNQRFGVSWEIRRLSTLRGEGQTGGVSLGDEQLSFWRATMAVAVRY